MKPALALFDFDGTISKRDSGAEFIFFTSGFVRFILGGLKLLPLFVLYLLKLISDASIKQKILIHFFQGWPAEDFEKAADRFSMERLPSLIKRSAQERIAWHKSRGDVVVVVSASFEIWLRKWCENQNIQLIGSKLEIKDGKITGKIAGKNCKRMEKVNRIREKYNLEDFDEIYAYGDSIGDKEMLAIATHAFYRNFK